MDNAILYRLLKLTETKALESIVLMIKKIATHVGQDLNLPKECKESLIDDLPMKVFQQWYQYHPKYKLESWIYTIAHKEALSSLPYYLKAKNYRSAPINWILVS